MTPQPQCDRCYRLGPVTFDDEQGDLCETCAKHFEEQRAQELDEKERYDNSPFNWDGMPYAYDE